MSGILINTGFKVGSANPVDDKSVVQTIVERDQLLTDGLVYESMQVYVRDTKTRYEYNGTEWVIADASADVDSMSLTEWNDFYNTLEINATTI